MKSKERMTNFSQEFMLPIPFKVYMSIANSISRQNIMNPLPSYSRWSTIGVAIGVVAVIMTIAYCIFFNAPDGRPQEMYTGALVNVSSQMAISGIAGTCISAWLANPPIVNLNDLLSITKNEFLERFEGFTEIGKGAEGSVFRAKDQKFKRNCALKFFNHTVFPLRYETIRTSVSFLLDQGITPHLTRGYETLTIKENNDVTLISELLDGDLEKSFSKFNYEQRLSFELQNIHTVEKLQKLFNVAVIDNQQKNRFYVTLSNEHTFNSYRLADYNYWKYRICGVDIYIPKPSHLLKLGDYDHWGFSPFKRSNESDEICSKSLEDFAYSVYWAPYSPLRTPKFLLNDALKIIKEWTKEPQEDDAKILVMD